MKIGVIGIGIVGAPMMRYFEEILGYIRGENLFLYDADYKKGYLDDINSADIIFVSVPTPSNQDGSADLLALENSFQRLQGEKIVVIRSTVPPGTTEAFQKRYPNHKVLFNPEFLDSRFAWEQFVSPSRQIVGFTSASQAAAALVLKLLPRAPFMSEMTATEAELGKYASNVHYARKVNLANIIASLAEKLGANYDKVRLAMAADYRIGDSHLDVKHGGYRGFGGGCLPKDLDAFIVYLKSQGLREEALLLRKDKEFNQKLLASQGLDFFRKNEKIEE